MSRLTPIHFRRFCKILEKEGFSFSGQSGDHLIYHKAGISRAIVIPRYKQLPIFIIKNNLRTAGISREKYLKILKEI